MCVHVTIFRLANGEDVNECQRKQKQFHVFLGIAFFIHKPNGCANKQKCQRRKENGCKKKTSEARESCLSFDGNCMEIRAICEPLEKLHFYGLEET